MTNIVDYTMLYETIRLGNNILLRLSGILRSIVMAPWFWSAIVALLVYRRSYYEAILSVVFALILGIITYDDLPLVISLAIVGYLIRVGTKQETDVITHPLERANWRLVEEMIRRR